MDNSITVKSQSASSATLTLQLPSPTIYNDAIPYIHTASSPQQNSHRACPFHLQPHSPPLSFPHPLAHTNIPTLPLQPRPSYPTLPPLHRTRRLRIRLRVRLRVGVRRGLRFDGLHDRVFIHGFVVFRGRVWVGGWGERVRLCPRRARGRGEPRMRCCWRDRGRRGDIARGVRSRLASLLRVEGFRGPGEGVSGAVPGGVLLILLLLLWRWLRM